MNENNELLLYIYQNCTMGEKSLEVLFNTINHKDNKIKKEVNNILKGYKSYVLESTKILRKKKIKPKEKSVLTNMGSFFGIKMELLKDNSDSNIANMIIQGLNMGVLELEKEINNYEKTVDKKILILAKNLKKFQEDEIKNLKPYI